MPVLPYVMHMCCAVTLDPVRVQTLLKKFSIAYWRTPEYNYMRVIVTVSMAFVLGTLYWKIGHKRYRHLPVPTFILLCGGY